MVRRTSRSRKATLALPLILGLAFLGFGSYRLWLPHSSNSNTPLVVSDQVVTESPDIPDESPATCSDSRVPAKQPKKIIIDAIEVDACIQKVGIDPKTNSISVPGNINVTGWYINSALPGDEGVSIIDGHVHGVYNPAVFIKLSELVSGDKFQIQFGDDTVKTFEVVSVGSYSVQDTASEQYKQLDNVKQQLTLITCTGSYDKQSKTYNQRTLVRSKLVLN